MEHGHSQDWTKSGIKVATSFAFLGEAKMPCDRMFCHQCLRQSATLGEELGDLPDLGEREPETALGASVSWAPRDAVHQL